MMKNIIRCLSITILLASALPTLAAFGKDDIIEPAYTPQEWPNYSGPKVGIAVLTFEDGLSTNPESNWINADSGIQVHFGVGEGLSNILVSTLMNTNRFTVVDKKIARRIFDMYSEDTAKKIYSTGAGLPKVPGIKYFVLGSLTAFDDGNKSADAGIGFGGVKLSGGKSVAALTIHMRIIDATNGQVVYSKPVEGVASVTKGGISIGGADFSASLASPLGQAVQKMLDKATDDIITTSFPGAASVFQKSEAEEAEAAGDSNEP